MGRGRNSRGEGTEHGEALGEERMGTKRSGIQRISRRGSSAVG